MLTLTKRDLLNINLSIPHQLGRQYMREVCNRDMPLVVSVAAICGFASIDTVGCWSTIGATIFATYEALISSKCMLAHWHDEFSESVHEYFEDCDRDDWGLRDLFGDCEWQILSSRVELFVAKE